MFFGFGRPRHREVAPGELMTMLKADQALVVDVREAAEFLNGHIPGSINLPLSRFQPSDLPHNNGKLLILSCRTGRRSGMALDRCKQAGAAVETHLAGGFEAWRSAGLPIVS